MTMIYIPSGKYLEGEHPEMDVGIEGWFTLRALNRYGRVVRERTFKERRREVGPFHNLLLNNGLNRFATQLPESAYRGLDGFELERYAPGFDGQQPDATMEYWLPVAPR